MEPSLFTERQTKVQMKIIWLAICFGFDNSFKDNNAVPLNFTHKLAKINATLTSDEIEDLSGASIYICATKNSVNFNTTTSELTSLSSAEYNDVKAGTTTSTKTTASAIVIPRTVPANTGFIKVVKGGKTFTYNLTKEIKLESGKSYSYTVNLKEKQIQMAIVSSSITSWDNNDLGEVDADCLPRKNVKS